MNYPINDPYFRVEVLSKTKRPNLLSYLAMHQDYCEDATFDDYEKLSQLSESELGDRLVRKCIKFSHWGVLEHPSITLNVIGFPHSAMVQARTHRVGITFDCQSMRFTGKRLENTDLDISWFDDLSEEIKSTNQLEFCLNSSKEKLEKLIYLRPLGFYADRHGIKKEYTLEDRNRDLCIAGITVAHYAQKLYGNGYAPEHARGCLVYDFRQDFVVTFNARSLLHFCDLRLPKDAQLEIRTMAEMLFEKFKEWMPSVAEFYEKNRKGKNKLAP